jgi:hypothetical protein
MTGTGTELDPYVVDNIADCLTAISESGAYVCLGANIHVKNDPIYREGITSQVNINCTKFYSDSSNIKGIYGLTFKPDFSVSTGNVVNVSDSTTIQDINFFSILVSGGGFYTKQPLFNFGTNTIIKNVSVSSFNRFSNTDAYTSNAIAGGKFDTCSIYIRGTNNHTFQGSSHSYMGATEMNHCYIYLDNICFGGGGYRGIPVLANIKNSTIYADKMTITEVSSSFNNGYFRLLDTDSTHNIVYADINILRIQWSSSSFYNDVISDNGITVANIKCTNPYGKAPTPSGVVQVSYDELKDLNVLMNAGFLP